MLKGCVLLRHAERCSRSKGLVEKALRWQPATVSHYLRRGYSFSHSPLAHSRDMFHFPSRGSLLGLRKKLRRLLFEQ